MNLLVAGGLLILGILFLVALIFVIRSEPAPKESASIPSQVPTKQEKPQTRSTADKPSSKVETQLTPDEGASSVAEKRTVNERYPLANGQFYELVNELRSMRSQTQELERRLSALIDMAQRVEREQGGSFPSEEQGLSDSQSAH